jgi:ceramide glucosyltransferase
MTTIAFITLAVIWTAWVLQSVLSAWQARKFLSFISRDTRDSFDRFRPPAAVVVPFKGIDTDLAAGVRGLCEQDYGDYRLLLVVESAEDPAYEVLVRELARFPQRKAEILIAGPAGPEEGQKVHNQLFAIDKLLADGVKNKEVWIFADSDAVPDKEWLQRLVGPLGQLKVTGVTTGYRWLIPKEPATVWSRLASVMNSSVACMFGRDQMNHAWGGSMGIRAEVAVKCDLRGHLVGALCDDYQFTRAVNKIGLRVYFVPQCLVASPVDFSFAGLVNFAQRQYLLTRVYAPLLFLGSLLVHGLYFIGFTTACAAAIFSGVQIARGAPPGEIDWRYVLAAAVAAIVLSELGNRLRASLRRRIVRQAFGSEIEAELEKTLAWDRRLTCVWMSLHLLLVIRGMLGSTMNWRGIRYRLYGPQRVKRLN